MENTEYIDEYGPNTRLNEKEELIIWTILCLLFPFILSVVLIGFVISKIISQSKKLLQLIGLIR